MPSTYSLDSVNNDSKLLLFYLLFYNRLVFGKNISQMYNNVDKTSRTYCMRFSLVLCNTVMLILRKSAQKANLKELERTSIKIVRKPVFPY